MGGFLLLVLCKSDTNSNYITFYVTGTICWYLCLICKLKFKEDSFKLCKHYLHVIFWRKKSQLPLSVSFNLLPENLKEMLKFFSIFYFLWCPSENNIILSLIHQSVTCLKIILELWNYCYRYTCINWYSNFFFKNQSFMSYTMY